MRFDYDLRTSDANNIKTLDEPKPKAQSRRDMKIKRLASEVNNVRMVALINPEGRFPMPTKLDSFERKESKISEVDDDDSNKSDVPEVLEYVKQKTIHEWLRSDVKVPQKPQPPREKFSMAAKRRASAADCNGS